MPRLFSYGTLQQDNVQVSTFGRLLHGSPDQLLGYELSLLRIEDPDVIATSGKTHHPIATFTSDPASTIDGTVFEVTDQELVDADRYEVSDYVRVLGDLQSGGKAWVYVARRA